MKRDTGIFQKMFGSFAVGSGRMPLRSNVYNTGNGGYSPIGQGGGTSLFAGSDRKSPLLGTAGASNRLSSYYEKVAELKTYQLLDISKLATNFFADYIINFLSDENNSQVVTILGEDGEIDQNITDHINEVLTDDLRIFDYIRDHVQDYVYFGGYFSMLRSSRDEFGHLRFRIEELYDPIAVVSKKKRDKKTGEMTEVFLAKGDDGTVYEIPKDEIMYIASNNFRLVNDLSDAWKGSKNASTFQPTPTPERVKLDNTGAKASNREKVIRNESFSANEPLFYSLILKVKELVIKELLVSLISLRDLASVQIFLLQFDKSVPLESANELCARATKLANNTNEVASFLTSQFDVVSFIENTVTQSAKFIPDYNATMGSKNQMVPLDKLSDKLLEILQTIDQCRANVLGPLGLPLTIVDSTSGSKWQVLQQSERANSRVSSFMAGIKDSVTNLVCGIYKKMYDADLNPSRVRLHICEKTSVEYNNQINQSESISGLLQGINGIIQGATQLIDSASPLIDADAFLTYVHNLIKDIDPNTENLITDTTKAQYVALSQAKLKAQCDQMGIDSSILDQIQQQSQEQNM